jgi:hypothetical protein
VSLADCDIKRLATVVTAREIVAASPRDSPPFPDWGGTLEDTREGDCVADTGGAVDCRPGVEVTIIGDTTAVVEDDGVTAADSGSRAGVDDLAGGDNTTV